MSSREVVLRRVREALGRGGPAGRATRVPPTRPLPAEGGAGYRRSGELPAEARADLFAERAGEYRVTVRRVTAAELPGALAEELSQRGVRDAVAPADLPEAWRADEVRWHLDRPGAGALSVAEVDACDAVVTGSALAVAETGTILFDGGPRQGRRLLTLLPDLHLCVVEEGQVVQTVPEAILASREAVRAGAAITLVAGPSATSDIELDRVEGVHGPRTLVVVLVR